MISVRRASDERSERKAFFPKDFSADPSAVNWRKQNQI